MTDLITPNFEVSTHSCLCSIIVGGITSFFFCAPSCWNCRCVLLSGIAAFPFQRLPSPRTKRRMSSTQPVLSKERFMGVYEHRKHIIEDDGKQLLRQYCCYFKATNKLLT
uniref:Uncharacterized protein n=1 Tax=Craspedostauros australis TaxID=1486917 RepID=A0A7R9WXD1_9STRA